MALIKICFKNLIKVIGIMAVIITLTGCFNKKEAETNQTDINQKEESADVQKTEQTSEDQSDTDVVTEVTVENSAGNTSGSKEDEVDFSAPPSNDSTASQSEAGNTDTGKSEENTSADNAEPENNGPTGLTAEDNMDVVDDQLDQDATGNDDNSWGPLG